MNDISKDAEEIIKKQKRPECACQKCTELCIQRPCWGTPSEIRKIIKAGYVDKLMDDYWSGGFRHPDVDVHMIQPAIVGYEKGDAPWWPKGRCALLDEKGKCMIHKIKPAEGAIAIACKDTGRKFNLHEAVAKTWDNDKAQELVEKVNKAWISKKRIRV